MASIKLSALEKSHLASLAKEESWAAVTNGDFKALDRLVKLGYIRIRQGTAEFIVTPKGGNFCRKAENMFTNAQIAVLRRRIARGKYWIPEVGQLIYTNTRMSIDHGEDDVQGGLSQVTKVYQAMSGGDPHCVMVEIAQHGRGSNWTQFLFPDQKELMKRFGSQVAYPDPDYGNAHL